MKIITKLLLFIPLIFLAGCSDDAPQCYPAKKLAEYNKDGDCTFCSLFRIFFNTVSEIAATANDKFSKPVIVVVAVAFCVWLAIYVLKYLASMETRDVKDVLQEVVVKGFQVILAAFILNYGATNFYKWLINPVYETALRGGQAVFENCSTEGCPNMINSKTGVENVKNGLPKSMGDSIVQTMIIMENNISKIRAFGSSLLCYSWANKFIIIPKIKFLVPGLVYWCLAMLMIIIIPLIMIDAVFELSVAVALLPMAIGCYPFKPTRKYSQKVWDSFLNSAFCFLFVSLVVIILLKVLQDTAVQLPGEAAHVTWDKIFEDKEGAMDEYANSFGFWHIAVLKLVFVFVLAWSVMKMGKEFADEFASSISNTDLGSKLGTVGAKAVKGFANKALKPLGNSIKRKVKDGVLNVRDRISTRRAARRAAKKYGIKSRNYTAAQEVELRSQARSNLNLNGARSGVDTLEERARMKETLTPEQYKEYLKGNLKDS